MGYPKRTINLVLNQITAFEVQINIIPSWLLIAPLNGFPIHSICVSEFKQETAKDKGCKTMVNIRKKDNFNYTMENITSTI